MPEIAPAMSPETAAALAAINRRFYQRFAGAFSATRRSAWPGWERLPDLAPIPEDRPLGVLDAGCGNGRFAAFLARHFAGSGPAIRFLGVDDCPELLAEARRRGLHGPSFSAVWRQADLLGSLDPVLDDAFDWIALFGVLHHIPGFATRARLLADLSRRLAPGGAILASVWRFDRPGWERRTVPWSDAAPEIDTLDLETGDHLLTWAGDREHPRYCHLADDDEVDRLLTVAGLACRHRFASDGPSGDDNLYLVLGPA